MTNAWFLGMSQSVPQSENEVRSTVEPIRDDSANVEASGAPDWNEFESDSSGELVGLSPRVKAPDTVESQDNTNPMSLDLAAQNHNALIDNQVATSGTAAAREARGEAGHGTMQYAESLEPVIRPGAAFGNEYFDVLKPDIQDGAGNAMNPTDTDAWNSAVAQSVATSRSRQAYQASAYNAFLQA